MDIVGDLMKQVATGDNLAMISKSVGGDGKAVQSAGSGMVSTLFGSQMGMIQNAISQKTGLPPMAVGKVMEIATPLVMGYVGKMYVSQKMDTKSLTTLLGDQSRMAMQASPDTAAMAKQMIGDKASSGGVSGILKKVLGK